MNRQLPFALVALVFAQAPLAPADETAAPETLHVSLAQAIARAREASPRLAQLASLQSAADAALRGARAQRLPQLDLSASYTRNSNVPELSLVSPGPPPTRQTVFPNIPDNYRTRAGVSLPLYTGGRVEGGIAAASAQQEAAAKDRAAGESDLVLETSQSYWGLVNARQSARVLTESVASYDAHLKDARNRFDLGMAARNELLAVQVERDRAELSRLRAQSGADIALADLQRLLNLPPSTQVEPEEPLELALAPDEDVEALVASALAGRSETAALKARIAAADASARAAGAGLLPQANLTAGYDYARPNSRILPLVDEWKSTWSVGVSVSLTAFDGGRTRAAAAQARAQAEAARHQLDDAERRIRLEVTSRRLELVTARATLGVAERNLEAAREGHRVEQDRYQEGVGSSSDLLDAETRLLEAGLDRTVAVTGVHLARAGLDRAAGR